MGTLLPKRAASRCAACSEKPRHQATSSNLGACNDQWRLLPKWTVQDACWNMCTLQTRPWNPTMPTCNQCKKVCVRHVRRDLRIEHTSQLKTNGRCKLVVQM